MTSGEGTRKKVRRSFRERLQVDKELIDPQAYYSAALALKIRLRYMIALFILAALGLASYGMTQHMIGMQADYSHLINVSGRQRMYSQRLALLAEQLPAADSPQAATAIQNRLIDVARQMATAHSWLSGATQEHPSGEAREALIPDRIAATYTTPPYNVNRRVQTYLRKIGDIARMDYPLPPSFDEELHSILEQAEQPLLTALDKVTQAYDAQAQSDLLNLQRLHIVILVATLLTFLALGLFLFKPLESGIRSRSLRLSQAALFDSLTGAPNRKGFEANIHENLLRRQQLPEHRFSVCVFDLNNFREINDIYGNAVGDELLIAVYWRLSQLIRRIDVLAREGDDKFGLLLADVDNDAYAIQLVEQALSSLHEPYEIQSHVIEQTFRVGIVHDDGHYENAHEMLRDADLAIDKTDNNGSNYEVFTPELRSVTGRSIKIESRLRSAVAEGELTVHFQPIYSIQSNTVSGCEALVRWDDHALGKVPPDRFIPVAERSNLIIDLDRLVLAKSCAQFANWLNDERITLPENARINVNISARQFGRDDLCGTVQQILADTGLPPQRLCLELTESIYADAHDMVSDNIRNLQENGIRIALDDFGTGYSALSYLQRFRVDSIKIDRSFVNDMLETHSALQLVQAILGMIHGLDMDTVAEGVETIEQLDKLRVLGCDYCQGYLLSPPLPADPAREFLCNHPTLDVITANSTV